MPVIFKNGYSDCVNIAVFFIIKHVKQTQCFVWIGNICAI